LAKNPKDPERQELSKTSEVQSFENGATPSLRLRALDKHPSIFKSRAPNPDISIPIENINYYESKEALIDWFRALRNIPYTIESKNTNKTNNANSKRT
jgi:hypothetical protein